MARKDRIYIHLREEGALVVELFAGDLLELVGNVGRAGTSVSLHDPDDNIFAAALAAQDTSLSMLKVLPTPGSVTEKDFEPAPLALRGFLPIRGQSLRVAFSEVDRYP